MKHQKAHIVSARADAIDDETLATMIGVLDEAVRGQCSEEGAALLKLTMRPCLEELQTRRRAATVSAPPPHPDNVHYLPQP